MNKKQLNLITKSNAIYIASENGKAIFYAYHLLDDLFFKIDTEIKFQYLGSVKISPLGIKSQLSTSLQNCKEIDFVMTFNSDKSVNLDKLKIGSLEVVYDEESVPLDFEKNPESYDLTGLDVSYISKYASTDKTRVFLNSVFFAKNGDIVATDGRRMGIQKTEFEFTDVLIPSRVFKYLKTSKITLSLENDNFIFKCTDYDIMGKCVNGCFPNYQRVIPNYENNLEPFWFDFDFKGQKSLICELTNKDYPRVTFTENKILCQNYEVGITNLNSEPVIFNSYFINDLQNKVNQCFLNTDKPCVFCNENKFIAVIMPCRCEK